MKRISFRMITLLLVALFVLNPVTVFGVTGYDDGSAVEPQASNYISSTSASVTNTSGKVVVSFCIVGTGKMNSIGATQIQIKDSTGTVQKTFNYTTTSGMMSYNSIGHIGSVTYYGSASTRYYAVVTFRASNSTGSDTSTFITGYG